MSSEPPAGPNRPLSEDSAYSDWERQLNALSQLPPAPGQENNVASMLPAGQLQPAADETVEEDDPDDGRLACGLCYRPFFPTDLTVASKERFNWEAAVVVCQDCLTELRQEMRARSQAPDLALGLVWSIIGFTITVLPISAAIWSIRSDNNTIFWQWLGCYFAFAPGYVIGRLVRYGVGRRHSLEQQMLAMFFTLSAVVLTSYVGYVAENDVFLGIVNQSPQHSLVLQPFNIFLTGRFWPILADFSRSNDIIPRLLISLGIVLGLVVAYFSSEGARIFTRPFAKPAR